MTAAQSLLHFVGFGSPAEGRVGVPAKGRIMRAASHPLVDAPARPRRRTEPALMVAVAESTAPSEDASPDRVGGPDLRAAAFLVANGYAPRVILSGFPAWPALAEDVRRLVAAGSIDVVVTSSPDSSAVDLEVIARAPGRDA